MSCADRPEEGEKKVTKLVRALQKDFTSLYVKGYTTGWKTQRWIRNIELGIMRLENTEKLIEKAKTEAKIEVLEEVVKSLDEEGSSGLRFGTNIVGFAQATAKVKNELSNLKKKMK